MRENYDINFTIGSENVVLGTIPDATQYLKFYKCAVNNNRQVIATSITEQMQEDADVNDAVKYKANNGILIGCDLAGMEKWANAINVAAVIDQIKDIKALINQTPELKQMIKDIGYEAYLNYATNDFIKNFILNNSDLVKEVKAKIMPVIKEKAATLVAQYTENQEAATGDAKSYGEDNMLVPVTKKKSFTPFTDEYIYYILYNGQFHSILDNSSEVSACKAILKVPRNLIKNASAARRLTITKGDGETTSIDDSEYRIESEGSETWFNLSGQRIDKPTKPGLYIRNGKKVVIK